MVTKFDCVCGNRNPGKVHEYDGCLGYEALVCMVCGRYYDHFGEHARDEWSEQFVRNYHPFCLKCICHSCPRTECALRCSGQEVKTDCLEPIKKCTLLEEWKKLKEVEA